MVKADSFRLPITAHAGAYRRADDLILTPLASSNLTAKTGTQSFLEVSSLKLFELKKGGAGAVPCDYADGRLIFRLAGKTEPLTHRKLHLYYNMVAVQPKAAERRGAVLTSDEPLPGQNLVANWSFEEPVKDATGAVLSDAEIDKLQHTNLVPDPGFEKGDWDLPTNAAPLKVALERGAGRDGGMGLVIEAKAATPSGSFVISSKRFPVKPKAIYQPRVWQWLDKQPPTGSANPFLFFLDETGKPLPVQVQAYCSDKPDGNWHQATYLGTAPDNACFGVIQIHFGKLTDTRCVFDDFEVYERVNPPSWLAGYHSADPGMEVQLASGDAADGNRAIRLRTSQLGGRCTASAVSKRFPIRPNTTYAGGCSAKVIEAAATAFSFAAFDKDGKPAMDTWNVFSGGAGGVIGKWETTRSAGRTKPNAVWGEMLVSVGWGKGEALFDNIFLRETPTGDAVKITFGRVQKKPWFVW